MNIQQNVSLKQYNTLAIDVLAAYLAVVNTEQQLLECLQFSKQQSLEVLILGGGSNIVLTKNYMGLVIQLNTKGIVIDQQGDSVLVHCKAGENWHQLVHYCLTNNYHGIENLALIPGSVGAAAIQNIGAYGVELKDRLFSIKGWDRQINEWRTLSPNECQLSYRDSVFKHSLKDKFIITELSLKLSKKPFIYIDYQPLQQYFINRDIAMPSPKLVCKAVMAIRSEKLPCPQDIANAGSFFKNPIINNQQLAEVQSLAPGVVHYKHSESTAKIAAGWLIEHAGWKGKVIGHLAMHSKQALVLTNRGASGEELMAFAKQIQLDILQRYRITLEIEPRVY